MKIAQKNTVRYGFFLWVIGGFIVWSVKAIMGTADIPMEYIAVIGVLSSAKAVEKNSELKYTVQSGDEVK